MLARDFDQMAERVRSLLASKETLLRYFADRRAGSYGIHTIDIA